MFAGATSSQSDSFPYTTTTGACYDSGDYVGALDKALAAANYGELRGEQARRRGSGARHLLGIGLCLYVEITNAPGGADASTITITTDGEAIVTTGASPTGQGHETVWATFVADRLGIPLDRIRVVYGDTDVIESGRGTMGSSSLQVAGVAVDRAATALARACSCIGGRRTRSESCRSRRSTTGDCRLPAHRPGASSGRRWRGSPRSDRRCSTRPRASRRSAPTFPFGAQVAVVEVDRETGDVALLRLVGADDAGTIINPDIFEGQLHGGFAQGVAQALYEVIRYDEAGNLLTSSFADYAIVAATELPSFELIDSQTTTPYNALGVKGVGESGTIGSTPAVQNAVVDALSHLGIRHIDMPATPERVWRAIQDGADHG